MLELAHQYPTDTYLICLAQLTKLAQKTSIGLDTEDVMSSLKPSRQHWDVIQSLRTEISTFRATEESKDDLKSLPGSAHLHLVELYLEELVCQLSRRSNSFEMNDFNNVIPSTRKCHSLAEDLLRVGPRLVSGRPSNWTYPEMCHISHAIIALLKSQNSEDDVHPDDSKSVNCILRKLELHLLQASQDNASVVSAGHNIYLRTAKQIRILRERYVLQKSVDAALREDQGDAPDMNDNYLGCSNISYQIWLGDSADLEMPDPFWYLDPNATAILP